jgi:hypothetical protein
MPPCRVASLTPRCEPRSPLLVVTTRSTRGVLELRFRFGRNSGQQRGPLSFDRKSNVTPANLRNATRFEARMPFTWRVHRPCQQLNSLSPFGIDVFTPEHRRKGWQRRRTQSKTLETFVQDSTLPVLVTAGLVHAQFETIHPFLDGNGRAGRMFISLLPHERKVLVKPVLYLRTFLKRHQARYFEHLTAVRSAGAWEHWLAFFLEGVAESARGATQTAMSIHRLRENDRTRTLSSGGGKYDVALLDVLFRQPLVNSNWVQQHLDVTSPTANKALARLCEVGILREVTGNKRNRTYRYDAYVDLFESVARVEHDDTHSD